MSCYLGYDRFRSPDAYGSCERFPGSSVTPETVASSAYWSNPKSNGFNLETMGIKLHAAYTDGHVESYKPSETVPMKVIKRRHARVPYSYGPGIFYIPKQAVR